jgi:hypothetical protein
VDGFLSNTSRDCLAVVGSLLAAIQTFLGVRSVRRTKRSSKVQVPKEPAGGVDPSGIERRFGRPIPPPDPWIVRHSLGLSCVAMFAALTTTITLFWLVSSGVIETGLYEFAVVIGLIPVSFWFGSETADRWEQKVVIPLRITSALALLLFFPTACWFDSLESKFAIAAAGPFLLAPICFCLGTSLVLAKYDDN